ncbi:hypothetical protein VPHD530_0012 [Vibrio phage D530]
MLLSLISVVLSLSWSGNNGYTLFNKSVSVT